MALAISSVACVAFAGGYLLSFPANHPGSGGPGAPPWLFSVALVGSFYAGGGYGYNWSFTHLMPGITGNWTQFYIHPSASLPRVNFTVEIHDVSGALLATFNSSRSTWDGGWWNQSIPAAGGWTFGRNVTWVQTDSLQLRSSDNLSGFVWSVGMGFPTGPAQLDEVRV